ncbi:MAG: MBL fold metallo-hydrolase [Chloroflexi bacterium]|nr:MBL fold metallo-hydrolase [Chloroflexota bacterium]MBL7061962.1 MBL fold metallo-hydrolase [Dehalococcoidia bacterium]
MEITWLGHSCFRIKGKEITVITDPCHPSLGYSLSKLQANIVTLSHFHPGHCYTEAITSEFKEIKVPGEYELKGVVITGIATWHDAVQGEKLGKNTVYLLEMDGMTLCHLGDLGHLLASELIEDMGDIDVLLLPVGGVSTIGGSTAAEIVRRLTPNVVIPMHYKTAALAKELEPVDKFLKEVGIKEQVSQPKLSVSRSNMPTSTQVVILDYPH